MQWLALWVEESGPVVPNAREARNLLVFPAEASPALPPVAVEPRIHISLGQPDDPAYPDGRKVLQPDRPPDGAARELQGLGNFRDGVEAAEACRSLRRRGLQGTVVRH